MAYINKEDTAKARKIVNEIGKKYGFKLSTTMKNNSKLNISLISGSIITLDDLEIKGWMRSFIDNHGLGNFEYEDLEEFAKWYSLYLSGADYHREWSGYSRISDLVLNGTGSISLFRKDSDFYKLSEEIEREVKKALNYYNNDDTMTDYFDSAFYYEFSVGKWDKPYIPNSSK
jgi:hypothetical protein